jgi:hypothetical protein
MHDMLPRDDEKYSVVMDRGHLSRQSYRRKSDIPTELLSVESPAANHEVVASTVQQEQATLELW